MVIGKSLRWVFYSDLKDMWVTVSGQPLYIYNATLETLEPEDVYYGIHIELEKSVNKIRL